MWDNFPSIGIEGQLVSVTFFAVQPEIRHTGVKSVGQSLPNNDL